MDIHEKLNALCEPARGGATRLGDVTGAARSTVYTWLNGKSAPTLKQALRISRAYGVPLEWLADDEQTELPQPEITDEEQDILNLVREAGVAIARRRLLVLRDEETAAVASPAPNGGPVLPSRWTARSGDVRRPKLDEDGLDQPAGPGDRVPPRKR